MKKFYPFKLKSWIYVLSILAIIILIIFMIVKILSVAGAGNLKSYHHTEDILAAVIMGVVAIILALFVFLYGLRLSKNYVYYVMGLLVERVKYEDIITINMDTAGEFMLIYYKVKKRGMVKDVKTGINADVILVKCKSQYFDNIIDGLRAKKPSLVVEYVTKNIEKR